MKRNIKEILNTISLRDMSSSEKEQLWSRIETGLVEKPKAVSLWVLVRTRSFLKKLLAVTLIFGTTATTAFAANSARPGDLLFPIDQAIEKIQLSLTPSAEKREELKLRFALERVEEVRQILEEVAQLEHLLSPDSENIQYQVLVIEEESENEVLPIAASEIVATAVDESLPAEQLEPESVVITVDTTHADAPTEAQVDLTVSQDDADAAIPENEENTTFVEDTEDSVITSIAVEEPDPISAKSKKRIELALGTTLEYLSEIQTELGEEDGNEENMKKINALFNDIQEQIDSLPEDMTFTITVKTEPSVLYDITVLNGAEVIEATVTEEEVLNEEPALVKETEELSTVERDETEEATDASDENESLRKEDEEDTSEDANSEEGFSEEDESIEAVEPDVTTTIEIDAGEHIGTIQIDIDGDLSSILKEETPEEETETL